ncbi:alpha/beta hydrolase [Streptomyces alboflavus]|uniref:alpha/beta hydrolase n=1 Tax=Streptomyces alboflavus TaxID=67267 RepID=UPI0004BFA841|nr:alpha/beta hydrolase [Streptomyces alboflavus]
MDYKTLKSLKPSEFEDAADGYRAASDMASAAKDRIENQLAPGMRSSLEGKSLEAALKQLKSLAQNFHYTQTECGLVATALNALAHDLGSAKRKLDSAVSGAQAEKFTVNPDGSVTYPAGGEKADGKLPEGGTAQGTTSEAAADVYRQSANFNPNPNFGRAQEYANRIAGALQEATEADEKWAPKLRKLKADDDLTVSHRDWSDVQSDTRAVGKGAKEYLETMGGPPKDGTPQDNAKWWKGLSDQERADYAALRPASVGALDGLPADVRDEANRTVLAEKRAQFQLELNSFPPMPMKYQPPTSGLTRAYMEWTEKTGGEDRIEFLRNSLKGMDAIQSRFDRTGVEESGPPGRGGAAGNKSLPPAYLLGFDPEGAGDGRVIIASGNPDTADHTAVYVPGTKASLGNIDGDLGRGETLWDAASRKVPGRDVSTITWLDYDTPRSAIPIMDGDIDPEAAYPGRAEKAGPTLSQFMHGVQEAQGGPEASHTTLVGHSYGSTVIGEASKHGGLAADDVVVAGSPGMQVKHADDLDVPKGHVWAMGAPLLDDPVPMGGKLVGLGADGNVPTDDDFGANIMKTDSSSHSGYWDTSDRGPSLSLMNQAAVIAGQHDEVKLD